MLGENVNKTVFVVWAGAIVAGLFGVSMALFPSAMNHVGDTIKKTTTDFIHPSTNQAVSLDVNIPNQTSRLNSWYMTSVSDVDSHDVAVSNPLFEPNTFDKNQYSKANLNYSDSSLQFIPYYQTLVSTLEPGSDIDDRNDLRNWTDAPVYNYTDGLSSWQKANSKLISPFKATDSNGDDLTGKIKFKSISVTKIETPDGTQTSDDKNDLESNYYQEVQFNHEYTNYKDLQDALFGYDNRHHSYNVQDKSGKWTLLHLNYTGDNSNVPSQSYDGTDYYHVHNYVLKSYLTATYSVTGKDGKEITKSSSFVVTDLGTYMEDFQPM